MDGDGADVDPFQFELVTQPVAAPGGMLQADIQDALLYFRRCSQRMGVVDRRQVDQAFDAMGLKTAFVLVELAARHAALPASS